MISCWVPAVVLMCSKSFSAANEVTSPSPFGRPKRISTFGERVQPSRKLMAEEVFWTDDLSDVPQMQMDWHCKTWVFSHNVRSSLCPLQDFLGMIMSSFMTSKGPPKPFFWEGGFASILGPRTASAAPNSQTAEFFPATEFCLSFRWNFGCLVFSQGSCRWHLQRPKSGSCRVPGDVLKQMGKRSWILRCSTQRCQCWCQRHSWKLVESWGVCANYPL